MRRLPKNKSPKQKAVIQATFDYFGPGITKQEKISAVQIALFLMGKRRGINLTEEQKSATQTIKDNLPEY